MDAEAPIVELVERRCGEIPVYWTPGPAPTAAALIFGVGTSDEQLYHRGVSHVVEHLALHGIDDETLEYNGQVDTDTTMFLATGDLGDVNRVFGHVTAALEHLPLARLERERTVLRTEAQRRGPSLVGHHARLRFGCSGPGLASMDELGLWTLRADDVDAWVRRWFVASNAAIAVTGPDPVGLRVEVPVGHQIDRHVVVADRVQHPAWTHAPGDFVAFSAVASSSAEWGAAALALDVAMKRRLRTENGESYSVVTDQLRTGPGSTMLTLSADCLHGDAPKVRDAMSAVLQDLLHSGVDPATLEVVQKMIRRGVTDRRASFPWAVRAAVARVLGEPVPTPAEFLAERLAVDADRVARALSTPHDGLLWTVPLGTGFSDLRYRPWPPLEAEPVEGSTFLPGASSPFAADTSLRLGPTGVSLGDRQGYATVRWAELEAACRFTDRTWLLYGSDGTSVRFGARDWFEGAEAVAQTGVLVSSGCVVDIGTPWSPDEADVDATAPKRATPAPDDPVTATRDRGRRHRGRSGRVPWRWQLRLVSAIAVVVAVLVGFSFLRVVDSSASPGLSAIPAVIVVVALILARRTQR